MEHVLHTPPWGDTDFVRLLKAGLVRMRDWLVRHSDELLPGGKLDIATWQQRFGTRPKRAPATTSRASAC